MNPLVVLPHSIRGAFYIAYSVAALLIGAAQVWFDPDPQWLIKALAVLAYIGVVTNVTALSNLGKAPKNAGPAQDPPNVVA